MQADNSLTEADFRAREQALDVGRSFIVQAPAGSGKTELLIQRYLKLLATVDHPEEVLAITFTRKAAREMQQRVSNALRQARAGTVVQLEHEQTTLDAAIAVLEKDRQQGWQLIETPRRMRIQTLDALCAGIARLLPLSSGIGGITNTTADADMKAIYRTAAVSTLDWLLDDDELNAVVENVLSHLDNSTVLYVSYIARMLESRDQWLGITGTGRAEDVVSVRERLEKNIDDAVKAHLSTTRHRLDRSETGSLPELTAYAGSMLCESGGEDAVATALANTQAIPDADSANLPWWRGLAELLLTQTGQWRKKPNKNNGFPTGDDGQKDRWIELIAGIAGDDHLLALMAGIRLLPDPRYDDRQWDVLLALLRLLPLAVTELKRVFAEQGVVDYVEVAEAAEAALGSPEQPGEIALLMDYKIRHLLLDEMQDTSIGQYGLLQKLTAGWESGDGRTLFCVGDPMQSIYRFRNAEVGQFVLAREVGVSGLPLDALTLRQNFRSGEHLVHWFNTVFDQIFPAQDDIASGAIKYSESVPVAGLTDCGEHIVHPLFDASVAEEASIAVDIIDACLSESEDQDVAVLVRSRTQLTTLLAELRKRETQYHAVEIDRLTDLPEIIDLLALTRAFCHMGDRTAWLGLLRGPLLGLTWVDLHRLVIDAPHESIWNLIQDESRLHSLSDDAQSLLAKFVPIVRSCFGTDRVMSLRRRIEQSWYQLGGPGHPQNREQLDNIYRFLEVLGKIETAGTIADPAMLEQRLDDERVSSDAGQDCRLHVMTIHKSKGLEFDHVVLPSLGRSTTGSNKAVLSWLNIPGEASSGDMIISPIGPSAELENDRLHQYIEARLKDSERLELDRLLYVACTRARKSLHLIGHVNTKKDGAEMATPYKGSLLHRLWPALESVYAEAFEQDDSESATPDIEEQEIFAIPQLRRADENWTLPVAPDLPVGRRRVDGPDIDRRPVEFYWVGTSARHAGTIVHRWLHRFVEDVPPNAGNLDDLNDLTAHWAKELLVPEDDIAFVCERVQRALAGILSDPQGQWILSGEGRAEFSLTGIWQTRVESIVIDRVRIDEHGVHWIIDYKTSTHEGGDLEEFLLHETDRYQPQLQKYVDIYRNFSAVPVKAALYFPLLQEFREIDVSPN